MSADEHLSPYQFDNAARAKMLSTSKPYERGKVPAIFERTMRIPTFQTLWERITHHL